MGYKFWKSLILTAVIMGMTVWLYILADTYLYAVAEILNAVLVVAGFISLSAVVFVLVYAEPEKRRNTPPWEREWQNRG